MRLTTSEDRPPGPGSGASGDDLKRHRLEIRFGYGFPAFSGRGYRFGWHLAKPAPAVLGFDNAMEGIRRGRAGGGGRAEHEIGFGWWLASAGGSDHAFEARIEARRRESANDSAPPEHEVGFRLTARF